MLGHSQGGGGDPTCGRGLSLQREESEEWSHLLTIFPGCFTPPSLGSFHYSPNNSHDRALSQVAERTLTGLCAQSEKFLSVLLSTHSLPHPPINEGMKPRCLLKAVLELKRILLIYSPQDFLINQELLLM